MNLKQEIKALMENVAAGRTTVRKAVAFILNEMGRGGRTLIVDENMRDLVEELAKLNYTAYPITVKTSDDEIKKGLGGKVFITHNGADFSDIVDRKKWVYGLIWVKTNPPAKTLAKRIEAVMMHANFRRNLTQMATITPTRFKFE